MHGPTRAPGGRGILAAGFLAVVWIAAGSAAWGQTPRRIALELYVDGAADGEAVATRVRSLIEKRDGLSLKVHDISDEESKKRHAQICAYFRSEPADSLPMLYGCSQSFLVPDDNRDLEKKLDSMRTMVVYVRAGCPRCAAAKAHLAKFRREYPGLLIDYRDVVNNQTVQAELDALARRYDQRAVSVPVYHFCNKLIVGFNTESSTGRRLKGVLDQWTFVPTPKSSSLAPSDGNRMIAGDDREGPHFFRLRGVRPILMGHAAAIPTFLLLDDPVHGERDPPADADATADDSQADLPLPPPDLPLPLLPEDVSDSAPLPLPVTGNGEESESSAPADDEVELRLFGNLRASEVGIPIFTIAIGLVDGFNPCAMWVLLFLLSILVNLRNRWKIFAVAGTFVFVSGLAYFCFMAIQLNIISWFADKADTVFVVLGVLAICIGAIHIKDFFAFKKGISLSIPESAKPGIYERVRRIVNAENLTGAIVGAAILAVLVNMVELLCTAGLPALYTGILSLQKFPAWKEYAYIGLYNVAYMFDDSLMVAIVIITLGKKRLQETQGRWLKFISGLFIFVLGVVMIVNPRLLQ